MKKAVIIVAAGSGTRMGREIPKQYLQLQGKPIIIHTLERFRLYDPKIKIIIVVAPGHMEVWDRVAASYETARGLILAQGGATRYESVKKGLKHVDQEELVGIHDAVRPLVSQETLTRCFDAAWREGSGIPVLEMDESVRILDEKGDSSHLDRSMLRRVQTPQVFRSDRIKKAYRQSYHADFTDDASVYETLYGRVALVEGNRENIKITTPLDLELAIQLMAPPG